MLNKDHLKRDLMLIREKRPLIQNITNYVAMNFTANALLAVGASPIMAHTIEEMEDLSKIISALVINIGTLDSGRVKSMLTAGKAAQSLKKPIILDPVGAGSSSFRTQTAWDITNTCHPSIIRGNGSEIMALLDNEIKSKGVDSSESAAEALDYAKILAHHTNAIVVISGKTDYITDGNEVATIGNGSKLMTSVTAMGCTATSIIGAFAAVNKNYFEAALHGMALMGVCGERASQKKAVPGSLSVNFIDELYTITPEQLADAAHE